MKTLFLFLALTIGGVQQTESIKGVYYPNVNETECVTDGCLSDLVRPFGAYNGEAY